MSESDLLLQEPNPEEAAVPTAPAPVRRKRSMFEDPLVRAMAWIASGLVILYLIGIASALYFGVITTKPVPRTAAERALLVAESRIKAGDHTEVAVSRYVNALIDVGRFAAAEDVLNDSKKVAQGRGMDLDTARVRLYLETKDYKASIAAADEAIKAMTKKYDAEMKKTGVTESRAYGMHENYGLCWLFKAEAYSEMGQWAEAVKSYDKYIEDFPTAANILVDRGYAKIELKDKAGAKADFKAALQYVADDQRALDGLKKIGASE